MENKGNKIEKFICNYCLTVLSQSEKCTKCGSTLISTLRPQKTPSDRELALEWWNNNLFYSQQQAINYAINGDYLAWLNNDQIIALWKGFNRPKPNQKQYKKFEPELFRAYIEKFSDEDKLKAFKVLEEEYILRLMFMDEAKEMDELNKI